MTWGLSHYGFLHSKLWETLRRRYHRRLLRYTRLPQFSARSRRRWGRLPTFILDCCSSFLILKNSIHIGFGPSPMPHPKACTSTYELFLSLANACTRMWGHTNTTAAYHMLCLKGSCDWRCHKKKHLGICVGVCVCVGTDFASATNLDLMALIHLSLSESLRAACNEIKVTSPLCLSVSL